MTRLLLVNPNTSVETTARMLEIARAAAPPGTLIEGATAPFGAPLITNEAELARAGEAVLALLAEAPEGLDGIILSAFGDPGLAEARARLSRPVTGIAEAGMAEAACGEAGGRAFAVATTTPGLADAITRAALRCGHATRFRGVFLTRGDPAALMADAPALEDALAAACGAAIRGGAEAVVIGGGPLAAAARAIVDRLPVPIVEPIPAAVRLAIRRARSTLPY